MKSIVLLVVLGAVMVSARPQGYNYGPPKNPYESTQDIASQGQRPQGQLVVECQRREVGPGQFKFTCEGINPRDITLQSEHVLWIQQDGGQDQLIDVEVPNYRIDELIKAGFKTAPGGGTRVNVLLKRPEQSYNAEVDRPNVQTNAPSVAVQYEPVDKILVHYPNDKPYRPLSGPILPPA
jgi:hypothetical protein